MKAKVFTISFGLTLFLCLFLLSMNCFSRTITQLKPQLTITEEYHDNFLRTATNKQEEYITRYGLSFSLGFLEKKTKLYLNYKPAYRDYNKLNERDNFEQNISLDATLNPSKLTKIKGNASYTSNDSQNTGESWENSASLSMSSQLSKNTKINLSHSFRQSFDEQFRTGNYIEHEVNKSNIGLTNKFGERDSIGFKFAYEFDDYENADSDEYTLYRPSGSLTYWFTPLNGFDTGLSFESKDLENSSNDVDVYSGHVRYLRKFSKHLDGFIKYRHSYSDRQTGEHTIYHPSIGVDWEMTEDSGISIGVGVLFNEWKNSVNSDSENLFVDLDVYKNIKFSKRSSLRLTANSGYSESGESSSSLGYTTYYKAGFKYSYALAKRLNSNITGSYALDDFEETSNTRQDTKLSLGGGLSWRPLKWLNFNLNYAYTDYDSDSNARTDYTANVIKLSVSLTPTTPIRPDFTPSRDSFEGELFD